MIYLAIAVIVSALLTTYLVNKWLNLLVTESNRKDVINTQNHISATELSALKAQFVEKINDVDLIRQEIINIRNQIALRK